MVRIGKTLLGKLIFISSGNDALYDCLAHLNVFTGEEECLQ